MLSVRQGSDAVMWHGAGVGCCQGSNPTSRTPKGQKPSVEADRDPEKLPAIVYTYFILFRFGTQPEHFPGGVDTVSCEAETPWGIWAARHTQVSY